MPSTYPSYTLHSPVPLQPLLDADGVPYRWVPCADQPVAWDEDQPISVQRAAARICVKDCPALVACAEYRRQLGVDARGVLAGEVLPRRKVSMPATPPKRRRPSLGQVPAVLLPMPDRVTVVNP